MLRDKLWHFGRSSPKTRFPAPIDPLFRPPRTNTLYSALYSEGWGAPALGMRRPSAAATALGLELRSDSGRWGERTREPGRCLALARGYARPTDHGRVPLSGLPPGGGTGKVRPMNPDRQQGRMGMGRKRFDHC